MTEPDKKAEELDVLLPLYNRRIFDEHLPQFCKRAVDTAFSLCLLMIDLDHFKSVNDKHGHQTGDEVLKSSANAVLTCASSKGTAYRYGGEELAVILQNFTIDEAIAFGERVRTSISSLVHGPSGLRITASIGIACVPIHATEPALLIQLADKALYEAKELGRDNCRVSGEPRPEAIQPRKPARKQPPPDGLSDNQRESIRLQYFRRRAAQCPRDGAILTVHEAHRYPKKTPDIYISCPVCGLSTELEGPE